VSQHRDQNALAQAASSKYGNAVIMRTI